LAGIDYKNGFGDLPVNSADPAPRSKWLVVAAVALGLIAAVRVTILYHHQRLNIEPSQVTLPADGAEHEALRIRLPAPGLGGTVTEDTNRLRLLESKDPAGHTLLSGVLRSPVTPGYSQLRLLWRQRSLLVPVTFVFDSRDTYNDGTPDFLRLHTAQDRQAFRAWFTTIAEAQLNQASLPTEIDDCAALLRFAYRGALHAHDETWLSEHSAEANLPSIRQYVYPATPLGANLFRVHPGPFAPQDIKNGSFAQFADAQTLMEHNTYRIARDLRLARPGDLIFYRQLDQDSPYDVPGATPHHSPFHSMIVCGENGVVYHTGPIHHGKGEMRRLSVTDLLHYPDARWRPLPENTNFLGVYRWNILREGD
jgi:uncharacterized protein YfaT (DUF1175 family)